MHDSFQNIPPPSAFLCSSGEMPAYIGGSVPEGQSGFAGWQRQHRRSTASLQPTGWTRLNPAGRGMCIEKHWPGIRNVRLILLNDSLATMSIRPTPSSLFDIKAKESEQEEGGGGNEWSEITEERGRKEGKRINCSRVYLRSWTVGEMWEQKVSMSETQLMQTWLPGCGIKMKLFKRHCVHWSCLRIALGPLCFLQTKVKSGFSVHFVW